MKEEDIEKLAIDAANFEQDSNFFNKDEFETSKRFFIKGYKAALLDTSKVNRVEVINHYGKTFTMALGRAFVFNRKDSEVEIDIQDEGKTLKVFISKKK